MPARLLLPWVVRDKKRHEDWRIPFNNRHCDYMQGIAIKEKGYYIKIDIITLKKEALADAILAFNNELVNYAEGEK
jgi:hypothetical protein